MSECEEGSEKEFIPRFVKVFNECKVYEERIAKTSQQQNENRYRQKMKSEIRMSSPKEVVKITSPYNYQLSKEQKGSWRDGAAISVDQSAFCKRKAIQMTLDNDRRKKIVRTNTDSEILIPKIRKTENPYQTTIHEEMSSCDEGSIENLKECLKEGRLLTSKGRSFYL